MPVCQHCVGRYKCCLRFGRPAVCALHITFEINNYCQLALRWHEGSLLLMCLCVRMYKNICICNTSKVKTRCKSIEYEHNTSPTWHIVGTVESFECSHRNRWNHDGWRRTHCTCHCNPTLWVWGGCRRLPAGSFTRRAQCGGRLLKPQIMYKRPARTSQQVSRSVTISHEHWHVWRLSHTRNWTLSFLIGPLRLFFYSTP